MCHLCGWLKLFLKNVGGEKNKKHWVGLSVGLLGVSLQYIPYVFHLSKWFTFSFNCCLLIIAVSVFTLACNVLRLGEGRESLAPKFVEIPNVQFSTNVHRVYFSPAFGNTMLYAVFLFITISQLFCQLHAIHSNMLRELFLYILFQCVHQQRIVCC